MSHRKRIGESNKIIYLVIMSAGALMAITVLFSLLAGVRINFLYSTLVNSATQIRVNVVEARHDFLKNFSVPSDSVLSTAWDYLSIAEFNTNIILEEQASTGIFTLPIDNIKLKEKVQQLQAMLLEYKSSTKDLTSGKKNISRQLWENQFELIDGQTRSIQEELNTIIVSQSKNFRFTQLILIGATLLLCFLCVFVFYRYEKQRTSFLKRLNEASSTIEKRTHKTTLTEEALQETQRRLSTLVQNLPGMVYRCKNDSNYTMEYVSDMCFRITGYTSEELLNNKNKSYNELIHTEDRQKVSEQIQIAVEQHKSFQLVYRIITASEFEKWVWEQGVGVYTDEDELIALEGFITDITEQKLIQDQLALQGNALEAAANGILITDKEGKILWTNNAFTTLTGYSLNEVMGKKPNILKSGEHAESFYAHMWSVILSGGTWRGEITNKKKNGEKYFEEMTITPVKNPGGEITHFVSIKQDISERKNAENALRDSEMRFRGLYENATVGIYRTSIEGSILMANPTLLKILGYDTFNELTSLEAKDTYFNPDTREIFKNQVLTKGRIYGFESKCKKKDGSEIFIRESARVVRDIEDRPIYFEGTIEDITEKKKAEEELIIAKERAELSDKLKSEFLAQMSHEIRTPLNVIINYTDMIREELQGKAEKELLEGLDVVDAEGNRILRTINMIVNMSQLQTGQYDFNRKKINLHEDVLLKLCEDYKSLAENKDIQFNFNRKTENSEIEADEYSVKQIFYQLIDNAVKFTPRGKIEITLNRDSNGRLYTDVVDTGIGMSEEYQKILFTPFTKEETGYTRTFEGNGLGLALAKKYCELNRASIKVKSIKGKGTAFRVTFF